MNEYHALPYVTGTPCEDFYAYFSLQDLFDKASEDKEIIMKCRAIGILQSIHGRFFLTDLDSPAVTSGTLVQVSVKYLQTHPPSTVKPYPVQIFGTLQWKNKPVIFAKILQELTTSNAIRVRNAMRNIAIRHKTEHSAVMDLAPT